MSNINSQQKYLFDKELFRVNPQNLQSFGSFESPCNFKCLNDES